MVCLFACHCHGESWVFWLRVHQECLAVHLFREKQQQQKKNDVQIRLQRKFGHLFGHPAAAVPHHAPPDDLPDDEVDDDGMFGVEIFGPINGGSSNASGLMAKAKAHPRSISRFRQELCAFECAVGFRVRLGGLYGIVKSGEKTNDGVQIVV